MRAERSAAVCAKLPSKPTSTIENAASTRLPIVMESQWPPPRIPLYHPATTSASRASATTHPVKRFSKKTLESATGTAKRIAATSASGVNMSSNHAPAKSAIVDHIAKRGSTLLGFIGGGRRHLQTDGV